VLVVVALIALFAALSWKRWMPATPVVVVRVEAIPASSLASTATTPTGEVAFQAAGWIEADPFLTAVSSLISGTVTQVPVLAGQHVEADAVMVRLNDEEQRLAVAAAEAEQTRSEAALRLAEARVRESEAEHARLPARISAATADRDERRDRAKRLNDSGTSVAIGVREQASFQALAAEHSLVDLQGSEAVLVAAVAAARAEVAVRAAAVTAAQVSVAQAKLAFDRTVIRAPHAGIIQRLHVRPGAKLMLGGDHPESATAGEIFDPKKLQVRVDVALADVGLLRVGQSAQITCEALGERVLHGQVTRIDGMADIARNTLQAKVAITEGDAVLRPEMLCRVQFFGNDSENNNGAHSTTTTGRVRLFVLASAVGGEADVEREVWVVDADNRAQLMRVRLGQYSEEHIEVLDGLVAGAWVIHNPPAGLVVGERVQAQELP
jgi:multidrug efflux pump subunit AcrA (membrane-fusion protein)